MQQEPSNALLTIPNLLTFLRLVLIAPFLWLALGPEHIGGAVAVGTVGFVSDLVDGKVARRFGQVSKLGIQLDPLSDRLSLLSAAIVLVVHDLAPWWTVGLVVARDLALLLAAPVIKARRIPLPPVTPLGKKASFLISLSFGLFVASGIPGVDDPSEPVRVAALLLFVVGIPMYYASGIGYARTAFASLRAGGRR